MYLSAQIGFLIGGEQVASLVNDNLNFRPSRDKVVHRETAANVSASLRKKIIF